MSKITIRLPDELIRRAKIRAIETRCALQDLTAKALEAYLKREGGAR